MRNELKKACGKYQHLTVLKSVPLQALHMTCIVEGADEQEPVTAFSVPVDSLGGTGHLDRKMNLAMSAQFSNC